LPVQQDYAFSPRFTATLPAQTPPQVGVYCTNAGSANVTVADRGSRLVTGALPVPGAPRGIALDPRSGRAYVALPREDEVQVLDVAASEPIGHIRLAPGDGPTELALAPDGKLLVVNERSRTVAFVDPLAMSELSRVAVGDAPKALVLDRSGRRAFVVNRGSATVTVLDVASQAVAGTISTEPEPVRVQVSRDGTRFYVVSRGSMYLSSYALPSLAPQGRGFIGLGAATIKVDARTDLIYLARVGEATLSVLEPVSLQIVDQFAVPGPVRYLAIDDVENTLLAVVPERSSIAVLDLTSRRLRAELPTGAGPYAVTLAADGSYFEIEDE
jgi:YVTN family beta-propeller protein